MKFPFTSLLSNSDDRHLFLITHHVPYIRLSTFKNQLIDCIIILTKKHQFPHLVESERGLISCPKQHRQQIKWYHNKNNDRAGTAIQICLTPESFILINILTASKALNQNWGSCIFKVKQSQSREMISEKHHEACLCIGSLGHMVDYSLLIPHT